MNYIIPKLIIITFALKDMAAFFAELLMEIEIKQRGLNILKLLIVYLLSCTRCFSFWTSIIISGDLFVAAAVSIITELFERFLIKKETLL